ncbi:hypothetical protein EGW08_007754 [Elysia chlorotica]|uniref:RING-type domain-containing protein n=1 Tax=Elysia chlorotica TaxID=188477 RepID=A0A3S0ZS41_ELYCH|nr:hypothetical protein EGW08_007754 [Elysia chlorotica]
MDELSCKEGHYDHNLQEQKDEVFALQEIFNTEEDEKLKILSQVTDEKDSVFSLLITICPKPTEEEIQVHVAMQAIEDAEEGKDDLRGAAAAAPVNVEAKPPHLARDVPLSRSISGQRWQGTFKVKFLLPFNLIVTFPPSYPSSDPPSFHLSCDWLTPAQHMAIELMLRTLWSEAGSMPIVFTWVDWLENNCLIEDQKSFNEKRLKKIKGKREAPRDCSLIYQTLFSSFRYNQEKINEEFCQTIHLCEICYDEFPGTQFFRIHECLHAFCHMCMQAFCEMHTKAGTVEELRCPTQKCDSIVSPYIIQAVLTEEAYNRWEQLLLQVSPYSIPAVKRDEP